jgi:hypothetical protein
VAAPPALARGEAPGGSYLRSCTDVRAFGDRLVAACRRADGGWEKTMLDGVDRCVGDIGNNNGQLTCNRARLGERRERHEEREGYGSSYGNYGNPPNERPNYGNWPNERNNNGWNR